MGSMGEIRKVVLAGGSGNVGKPVLQALLDADFEVTVLTRASSEHVFPSSVKVEKVDYDEVEALTKIFRGQDAFVSTVGTGGFKQQRGMVDAAVAAGVHRLIPSEFGSDISNPNAAKIPVFKDKVDLQDHIERTTKGTKTTWTAIRTAPFLDFCIDVGLFININKKQINLYDGGDVEFSATPLPMVAEAVVAVLRNPVETENRAVRIQGAQVTQNQLLRLAQKYTGEQGWEVTEVSTGEREKAAWEKIKQDPHDHSMPVLINFLVRVIFGEGFGGNFGNENDNKLLGIKQMSDQDVEEFIKRRAAT